MHDNHSQPSISPAAVVLLAIAVLAGTALAGLVAVQTVAPIQPYTGVGTLLGAITSLSGVGFIVQIAAAKVIRRLDQIEAKLGQQDAMDEDSVSAARRINLRLLSSSS